MNDCAIHQQLQDKSWHSDWKKKKAKVFVGRVFSGTSEMMKYDPVNLVKVPDDCVLRLVRWHNMAQLLVKILQLTCQPVTMTIILSSILTSAR